MDSLSFLRRNDLSALLLASIFMNGFETGDIKQHYCMSGRSTTYPSVNKAF
ncbi:MAG: hypothetical protein PUB49_00020 [Selenomonadaceae bacterium]|nr:hypothetical protein [Selenomonadaceae bacterium]